MAEGRRGRGASEPKKLLLLLVKLGVGLGWFAGVGRR